jgi:hypothetical protein
VTDLKKKLQKKSKEWLIDRLIELSNVGDANADRIALSLIADDEGSAACIAKFKRQIDKAVKQADQHGPASWESELPVDGFDSVADTLATMLPKNLTAVIDISEYALIKLDSIFELQDECELDYLVDAFRGLHLEALLRVKPDPRALGTRLAKLGKETEWGLFDGPPDGYSAVLGKEGLAAFHASQKSR